MNVPWKQLTVIPIRCTKFRTQSRRATAFRRHFFACGKVAPPSLPALKPLPQKPLLHDADELIEDRVGALGEQGVAGALQHHLLGVGQRSHDFLCRSDRG